MIKKISVLVVLCLCVTVCAYGFLYEIKILTKEEIHKVADNELIELYIEARIEEKASGEFHQAAGFSSVKDYNNRKKLLRYLFELRREMGHREQVQVGDVDNFFE